MRPIDPQRAADRWRRGVLRRRRPGILHGLCTLGVAFHAVLRGLADYRAGQLGHLQVRFSAPVFPGETLRTEMWSDGSFRTRVVERDVVVLDNGRVGPPPERPD